MFTDEDHAKAVQLWDKFKGAEWWPFYVAHDGAAWTICGAAVPTHVAMEIVSHHAVVHMARGGVCEIRFSNTNERAHESRQWSATRYAVALHVAEYRGSSPVDCILGLVGTPRIPRGDSDERARLHVYPEP
jgi:hypothetical protein